MLSQIINSSLWKISRPTLKSFATTVTKRSRRDYSKSLIFVTSLSSLPAYDWFMRDGETIGGIERFMRSLRIAVEVSLDYSIGLYGLKAETEEYNLVK